MTLNTLLLMLSMPALFAMNGLLFFRKGVHTPQWWLTLLPFALNTAFLVAFYAGVVEPLAAPGTAHYRAMTALGTVLCIAAIALFGLTVGAHRVALPMWHQPNDPPVELVTWGPYRYVRHPFYTSYYLYFGALLLSAPSWPIVAASAYGFLILNHTAAKEERELCASAYGADYRAFMARTGRFLSPLLRRNMRGAVRPAA